MKIEIIPQLKDNYAYLIRYTNTKALVIDPAESNIIMNHLSGFELTHILSTHHHTDHVSANLELQEKTGCWIIGPDDKRVPGVEQSVKEGDHLFIGKLIFDVIETPGHTSSHISYYLREPKALFCGDLLFCAGCGRLFEGTPSEMYHSLRKVCELPERTLIYPGHEYTLKNLEFASFVEPNNEATKKRLEKARLLRDDDKPTVPSTLKEEKETNPFLRVDVREIRETLNLTKETDINVFAKLRELKDSY